MRRLDKSDPSLVTFMRVPTEIEDRFAQGAICLGAFRGTDLIGWLWFVIGEFRDHTLPVGFRLEPAGKTAWDFDVYVHPEARMSAAFARLWEAAFEALRERGVTQTLSAISAYNPASLRAHRRLGATPFGSIVVVRLGQFQAVWSRKFRPHLQWSRRLQFCARVIIEAQPYTFP